MEVKSEREVTQSYLTLFDPMDHGPPGSSVHGIFQARVLEWGGHCLLRAVMLAREISVGGAESYADYAIVRNSSVLEG